MDLSPVSCSPVVPYWHSSSSNQILLFRSSCGWAPRGSKGRGFYHGQIIIFHQPFISPKRKGSSLQKPSKTLHFGPPWVPKVVVFGHYQKWRRFQMYQTHIGHARKLRPGKMYRGTEGSSDKRRESLHSIPGWGSKKCSPQWWTARHWKWYLSHFTNLSTKNPKWKRCARANWIIFPQGSGWK